MNKARNLFAMAVMVAAGSCNHTTTKSKPFLLGDYKCVGYNHANVPIAQGKLSISALTQDQFNGRWYLNKISEIDHEDIMYIEGAGDLVGTVDQKELELNFNPDMSDANYILNASIDGERLVGVLRWSGYAGGPELGRFEAIRVSTP